MFFKKYTILISLLIAITMNIYSQEIRIGIISSVDYDYRILENQKLRDDYEEGLLKFRMGIDIDKNINSRIGIKTGIRYIEIGYKTNDDDYFWGSEHNGAGGYEPNPILPYSGTIEHVYKYIEIPINLKYFFIKQTIDLYTEIGFSLNYSIDKEWKGKYDFNRLNVSTNIGFGINSIITDKYSIFGMPIFRYHLSKTLKNTIVENLYSIGLEIGMKMQL